MIASWFGYPVTTVHEDGNFQLSGPGTGIIASGAILLTLLGFGIVLWWRLRRFHPDRWTPALMYDAGFTVLLVMVVTSRVLSPQYLIWLVALAAACLTRPGTSQRTVALLLLACAGLTQLEFPVLWLGIVHGRLPADLVLLARNVGLGCAAALSARALWRSAIPAAVPAGDGPPASDELDARPAARPAG